MAKNQSTFSIKGQLDISDITKGLAEIRSKLQASNLGEGLTGGILKEVDTIQKKLDTAFKNLPGVGATSKQMETFAKKVLDAANDMDRLGQKMKDFGASDKYIKENIGSVKKLADELAKASKKVQDARSKIEGAQFKESSAFTEKAQVKTLHKEKTSKMRSAAKEGNVAGVSAAYGELEQGLKSRMETANKKNDTERYNALAQVLKIVKKEYDDLLKQVNLVNSALNEQQQAGKKYEEEFKNIRGTAKNTGAEITDSMKKSADATREVGDKAEEAAEDFKKMESANQTLSSIQGKMKSLFSAASVFTTLRRVVRGAIQDFMELDKQFNEIAIVSNYSTKEMWESFSSVNKVAQEFGVTTQNVLEVQNLYYHQGKSMAEVNKLTAQTLTLAKITGMDYASATSNLTAVLNAYNIAAEDAVRVTDTIAAMDTNAAISSEELMTALTKTASIAANAGMSLESTEVFLTKMIETTREAPENLGTALKTIIARFGEVKQEIDGEEVELADINRVDTALKSIGISLLDTAGQIRDLDGVFMELSSKWDDLDRNTQRYIATIAAGSRQQSRFIAMMENYDRTLELTEISQNSAGLSAKQLAKAQESIESSLNRLKSSWQEFVAGFVKSGMIKSALDFANNILGALNALNKISPVISAVVIGLTGWALHTYIVEGAFAKLKSTIVGAMTSVVADEEATEANAQKQGFLATMMARLSASTNAATKEINEDTAAKIANANATKKATKEQTKYNQAQNGEKKGKTVKPKKVDKKGKVKTTKKKVKFKSKEDTSALFKKLTSEEKSLKMIENKDFSKNSLKDLFQTAKGEGKALQTDVLGKLKNLKNPGSIKGLVKNGATKALGKLGPSMTKLLPTLGKVAGLLGGPVTAGLAAVAGSLVVGIALWKKYGQGSLDDTKAVEKLTKAQEKHNESMTDYNNIKKTAAQYTKLQGKTFKTAEELQEEQSAAKALVDEYPNLLDYIDEEGNYHLKNTDIINKEIEAKKKLAEQNQQAYNTVRLTNARNGVYADDSTAAGSAMSNLKSYYGSLDKEQLKELRKKVDASGTLDGGMFQKFAEAYASGEKTSFNYKDFSNLFKGQISKKEFDVLAQEFKDNGGKIEEALTASGAYNQNQIHDIVSVWETLNAETGGMYAQLLSGIGEEVNNIYVQEADMKVENAIGETDTKSAVKQDIKESYAAIKEREYNKAYESRSNAKTEAWIAVLGNIGSAQNQQPVQNYNYDASALFENTEKAANEAATIAAEEYLNKIEEALKDGENVTAINSFYESLGGKTLAELDGIIESTEKLTGVLAELGSEAEKTAAKEFTDFQEKIKELVPTINGADVSGALASSAEKLSLDQLKRLKTIYAQQGNEAGIAFHSAIAKAQNKKLDAVKINVLLDMDLTSVDSVIEKFNTAGLNIEKDKDILEDFIAAMGGSDALLFDDISQAAEQLQARIDKLVASLEKISKLASGSGDLAGLSAVISQLQQLEQFSNSADVAAFNKKISWGDNGIKYNDASGDALVNNALSATGLQTRQAQIIVEDIEARQAKGEEISTAELEQYNDALITMGMGRASMQQILYEEWKAKQDGIVKGLKEEIAQLEKIRDAYIGLLDAIRNYDYYQNLDRQLDDIKTDVENAEFDIEFSTNSDVVAEGIIEKTNLINHQIAANQAGQKAAEGNAAIHRDSLEKNYSDYVSFDESGTVIMNNEKMMELDRQIAEARAAGHEEEAKALEVEKQNIEGSVKAYEDSQKKADEYAKNLKQNFKDLEATLKDTFEKRAAAEEKIYEIIKQKEDEELQAVKDKYDAIKEENNKYLDSVRKMVEDERKIRDRADKESSVKDKEKKLAMMKMDTSGVYAADIKKLEKELEKDYQSLEDQAVDDALEELEQQFSVQEEQMDKEIAFLESSLEHKRQSYENYQEEVNEILMKGSDEATEWILANDSKVAQETTSRQELLRIEYQKTMTDGVAANEAISNGLMTQVQTALDACKASAGGFEEGVIAYGDTAVMEHEGIQGSINETTQEYYELTSQVSGLETAEQKLGTAIDNISKKTEELNRVEAQHYKEDWARVDALIKKYDELAKKKIAANNTGGGEASFAHGVKMWQSSDELGGDDSVDAGTSQKDLYIDAGTWYVADTVTVSDSKGNDYVKVSQNKDGKGKKAWVRLGNGAAGTWQPPTETLSMNMAVKKQTDRINLYHKYAKGGYVDYTGPAWVDGTKSHPEYMLNATQTAQFETLVAAMDNVYGNGATPVPRTTQNTGDSNCTFHINVEQMASDYDVDQLVARIEKKMIKASQYRNVNILKKTQ